MAELAPSAIADDNCRHHSDSFVDSEISDDVTK
jgi:hypothetical protein